MAPNFKTTTLAHSRLSLLLNNNNVARSFVGKHKQLSTYFSLKIPLYQSYEKKYIVQMRPLSCKYKTMMSLPKYGTLQYLLTAIIV